MKAGKCLFLGVFVFLSAVLYAQVLEPADADIFINGYSKLDSVEPKDNELWDAYQKQVEEVTAAFYMLGDFNNLKTKYQEFLKIKVPDELTSVFKSMGWNRNGHEKFWTIGFGLMVLMIQEAYDLPEMAKLLELFHKSDLAIIKTVVEKIKDEAYYEMSN